MFSESSPMQLQCRSRHGSRQSCALMLHVTRNRCLNFNPVIFITWGFFRSKKHKRLSLLPTLRVEDQTVEGEHGEISGEELGKIQREKLGEISGQEPEELGEIQEVKLFEIKSSAIPGESLGKFLGEHWQDWPLPPLVLSHSPSHPVHPWQPLSTNSNYTGDARKNRRCC